MASEDDQPATQQWDDVEEDEEHYPTQQWDIVSEGEEEAAEPPPPSPPPPPPRAILTRLTEGPRGEADYYTPQVIEIPVDKTADVFMGRILQGPGGGVNTDLFDERREAAAQRVSSRHLVVRWRNSGMYIAMLPNTSGGTGRTASGKEFSIGPAAGDLDATSTKKSDGWLQLKTGMVIMLGRHGTKCGGHVTWSCYGGLAFAVSFEGECGWGLGSG